MSNRDRAYGVFICKLATLCAVLVCANGTLAADASRGTFSGTFMYENAERTSYFAIRDGHSEVGSIEPKHPLGHQKDFQADTAVGALSYDCSDQNYRCMKSNRSVFAIPRGHLSATMTYAIAGTQFAVRDCLRGVGAVCQVALIRADCPLIKDAQTCELYPGGRGRSPHPGPLAYFIFNEDYGITSLGIVDDDARSNSEMTALAKMYVLQGNVGLLAQ